MSYGKLASVYDSLMKDVPYDDWHSYVLNRRKRYCQEGKRLLDVGCGTGELAIRLAKSDFEVVGVDLSEDMLAIAQNKAWQESVNIQLFQQHMCKLTSLGTFDIVTIFCDSLNYLISPEEVKETFKSVFDHLADNGLFMFDIHSTYKIKQYLTDRTYTENEEEVSYIWNCYEGAFPNSVEHELTLFTLDEQTGQYERFEEIHCQRTYELEQYVSWLHEIGFSLLEITADFQDHKPDQQSERLFFICQKNASDR